MPLNAKDCRLWLTWVCTFVCVCASPSFVAAGEGLQIERYSIDSGGGRSSGGGLVLHGTIAQYDAAESSGAAGSDMLVLRGGFWPPPCGMGECSPTIETIEINGEIWTDPTNGGTQVPPTVTLSGFGLSPTEVSVSAVHYTRIITDFEFDEEGGTLTFELPPFPPGPTLGGAIEATLKVANALGSVQVPIRYYVVRRTVHPVGGGDYLTIGAAIADARPGWAIVVEPVGTYLLTGTLNLGSLHSITLGGTAGGAHPNVRLDSNSLDILQINGSAMDRSVRIQSLDFVGGRNAIVVTDGANPAIIDVNTNSQRGIRVTNGANALVRDCQFSNTTAVLALDGGAVSVTEESTATIVSSSFVSNTGADRGTIYLENTAAPVLIVDNILRLNSANDGGAIYVGSGGAARIFGNILEDNIASSSQQGGRGGAIFVDTQPDKPAPLLEIANNRIQNNRAIGNSECEPGTPGGGGGIFIADAAPVVADNVIRGNIATVGGAVAICEDGNPIFLRNRFLCNMAQQFVNPTFFGPGIYAVSAEPVILNNLFFGNDLINPPPPPNNPSGAIHGNLLLSPGAVFGNNIFQSNYGWGMYLVSPGSEFAVDILFNDNWMNDQQSLEGLCPNCNPDCDQACTQGAPFDCCQFPGRTLGNVAIDPQFAIGFPSCSDEDGFSLAMNSPLQNAGLAFDAQTFVTAPYTLYHPQLAVDVGYIERDGLLSSSGSIVTVAREIASHAAVRGSSNSNVEVRIQTSALINNLDLIFFTFALGIPDETATLAMKFDFVGASPTIVGGGVELPLISHPSENVPIRLIADMDGNMVFDTVLSYVGEIDGSEGTVLFSDVDITGLEDIWLVAVTTEPVACPANVTADQSVDAFDLAALLGDWGACSGCSTDLVRDGAVNSADLAVLLGTWGDCP